MTRDEDRFTEYLQRLARELDPPPEVPREELWARIDAARRPVRAADAPSAARPDVLPLVPRRRLRTRHVQWAAALAAMLVLGIGIGRLTPAGQRAPDPAPVANAGAETGTRAGAETAAGDGSAAPLPYRLAAARHLEKTEALLTTLGTDARTGQVSEVSGWAGDLLIDTRLLLDSPAGQDAEIRKLLEDLELVLAQISLLQPRDAAGEVELIEDGMNQRDVLLRLRAATARPDLAGS